MVKTLVIFVIFFLENSEFPKNIYTYTIHIHVVSEFQQLSLALIITPKYRIYGFDIISTSSILFYIADKHRSFYCLPVADLSHPSIG